ncbi:MAG TPA: NAD-dependent epimerase/dehydratase family protein [Roseiarcus sp.]
MSEAVFPLAGERIWVAGHTGMVGSALVRRLAGEGCELITVQRRDVDLVRQGEIEAWIRQERPGSRNRPPALSGRASNLSVR